VGILALNERGPGQRGRQGHRRATYSRSTVMPPSARTKVPGALDSSQHLVASRALAADSYTSSSNRPTQQEKS